MTHETDSIVTNFFKKKKFIDKDISP